jgi:hypothetical protein
MRTDPPMQHCLNNELRNLRGLPALVDLQPGRHGCSRRSLGGHHSAALAWGLPVAFGLARCVGALGYAVCTLRVRGWAFRQSAQATALF